MTWNPLVGDPQSVPQTSGRDECNLGRTDLLCLTRLSCMRVVRKVMIFRSLSAFSVCQPGHSGFRPTLKGNSPHLVVAFVLAEATSLYITSAACLIVALPAAESCAWLCSLLLMSGVFPRCNANLCEGIRKCSCLMAFYRGPWGPREGNLRWKMSFVECITFPAW